MKSLGRFCLIFCITSTVLSAQDWKLKLSSRVELRKWKLTNAANKEEKSLGGAKVTLSKGTEVIGETSSDENGAFTIDIPANGDFKLSVSYQGCNTKHFFVTTKGVPEEVGKDSYKPTVMIGGFVLSGPISGVDYLGLEEPLVKVEYKAGGQNFDKDDDVTNKGLNIISKINESENYLISKFCAMNRLGDEALKKKKCDVAKDHYSKARTMMPEEQYPVEQLKKAEECLDAKKAEQEVAAEIANQKATEAKIANEKAIKEKEAKKNASFKNYDTEKSNGSEVVKTNKVGPVKNNDTKQEMVVNKTEAQNISDRNNTGSSKRTMPGMLDVDKYRETIIRADNYFKAKRYKEAKDVYAEAAKLKEKDVYARKRINECNQLLAP